MTSATLRYALLVVAGALLGLIGCFLVPLRVGSIEGWSVAIALVGNAVFGAFGGWSQGSVTFAAAPGVGWIAALLLVVSVHPGGDIILPGTLAADPGVVRVGEGFLFGGLAGIAIAMIATARFIRRHGTPTPPR